MEERCQEEGRNQLGKKVLSQEKTVEKVRKKGVWEGRKKSGRKKNLKKIGRKMLGRMER